MRRLACQWLFLITLSTGSTHGLADGSAVTQIYSPYVQPLEKELEFVWIHDDRHKGHTPSSTSAKVGYGTSLFTNLYTELSITHLNTDEGSLDEIELETIWQLTEQGEYSSDWGLLFELETALGEDAHEISLGVLNQKDINRWSIVSNVVVSYEWGAQRQDEPETRLGIQTRYRLGTAFEPTMSCSWVTRRERLVRVLPAFTKCPRPDSYVGTPRFYSVLTATQITQQNSNLSTSFSNKNSYLYLNKTLRCACHALSLG